MITRWLSGAGLIAVGLCGGVILLYATMLALFLAGFSTASVRGAVLPTFLISLIIGAVYFLRTRHKERQRAATFIIVGLVICTTVFFVQELLYAPQSVLWIQ